ncbi:hypothetical protein SDC9_119627 [bioreactor metagenome]|uniref:Uncharacterized protein n=1 Tax=bioreactor metagenome TaxID=1076179 RepID=A0A645C6N3_9ZZZZ
MVAQESLVQLALARATHGADGFSDLAVQLLQRISLAVIHRRRQRHRRRQEGLHLVETEVVLLQPQRQVDHVGVGRPRMRSDEVGNQVLLLARLARKTVEQLLEAVVAADAGLHHLRQRAFLGVLRGDLQVAADVVLDKFLDVLGRAHRQVIAQTGADQHLLDPLQAACATVERNQRRVVGAEVVADIGVDAGQPAAGRFDLLVLALQVVHVGGRPAEVGNDAGEARRLVAHFLYLADHRILGAALDDASFVLGDRAEGTAAETAAHDVDREADHLPGRDLRLAVGRMGAAGVG